jgi:hypothetical protein
MSDRPNIVTDSITIDEGTDEYGNGAGRSHVAAPTARKCALTGRATRKGWTVSMEAYRSAAADDALTFAWRSTASSSAGTRRPITQGGAS